LIDHWQAGIERMADDSSMDIDVSDYLFTSLYAFGALYFAAIVEKTIGVGKTFH
jgi:hypothetical protein